MAVYYTVTYNDYVFEHVKLNWTEQSVYASDNMTYQGTAYKFTISGVITENSQADFNDTIVAMKCALREPRATFTAVWGSDEEGNGDQSIIAISSAEDSLDTGFTSDIAWGPLPSNLQITEFIAGRAAAYSWTLSTTTKECFTVSCDDLGAGVSPILSLTAKWTHSIDPAGLTTRTVSGVLVLDSFQVDVNRTAADSYRGYVWPALPKGFKPDRQDYSQSEDGRVLTFSCTQVEKYYTLPQDILEGQVSMSAHTETYGGLINFTFSGYFVVPKTQSKGYALTTLVNIIVSRLSPYLPSAVIPVSTDYKDDIYTGRVDFNVTVTIASLNLTSTTLSQGMTLATKTFGAVPYGTTGISQPISPYGGDTSSSTGSGVLAGIPAPLDSCTQTPTPGSSIILPSPPALPTTTEGSNDPGGATPSQPGQGASQDHLANPYFEYHEEVSFHLNNGYVLFYPKSNNGSGVLLQQTKQPTVIITQAGYSSQAALTSAGGPVAAPPWYNSSAGNANGASGSITVLSSDVNLESPIPIGNGTYNKYTINWRYVISVVGSFQTTSDLGLAYPKDPRRFASGNSSDPFDGSDVGETYTIQSDYEIVDGVG